MIVYLLLLTTIFLAGLSIFLLWKRRHYVAAVSWHTVVVCCSLAIFIYLYGAWLFLSVYLKYVFAAVFAFLLIYTLTAAKSLYRAGSMGKKATNLFFSAVLLILSVLYFTGTTGKPYGVANLKFPFRNGTYCVFQGGKGLPTNVFHYALRGAVYAMDIVKLNDAGNRAKQIFSTRLQDYEIFNDTLYSPCNGRVLKAKDENPDNIPPNRERGPSNTNQVLLETDSFYVFLGHLHQHSVFVREGDSVVTGQPLGCAGNSGFTLEPHLHIQVHAKTNSNIPWYKEPPLFINFDGRSYLLFQEIKAPKK
jgi:hypothetical protein